MPARFSTQAIIKILLLFFLQLAEEVCYAQTENAVAKFSSKEVSGFSLNNKVESPLNSIQKVDSISKIAGPAQSFAEFYSSVMNTISLQIKNSDNGTQEFVNKFEIHFADYFLDAYYDYQKGTLSPASEWYNLFSHPELNSWQRILFGVNVHTNIDISQTIINNFSDQEIKSYKKQLLKLEYSIAKVYQHFFDVAQRQNGYLRFINSFTNGVAKFAGERWVYKWRKRNVKLAILYFKDPAKYQRKLVQVKKKKIR